MVATPPNDEETASNSRKQKPSRRYATVRLESAWQKLAEQRAKTAAARDSEHERSRGRYAPKLPYQSNAAHAASSKQTARAYTDAQSSVANAPAPAHTGRSATANRVRFAPLAP